MSVKYEASRGSILLVGEGGYKKNIAIAVYPEIAEMIANALNAQMEAARLDK